VTLIALISLLSGGAYLFEGMLEFSIFAVALGIFMTGVYLWGLLEWEDRAFLRMGWDSVAVVVLYLLGSVVLYQLS
jgi:cation:H+ antiporter